jgi:hypothetical protein
MDIVFMNFGSGCYDTRQVVSDIRGRAGNATRPRMLPATMVATAVAGSMAVLRITPATGSARSFKNVSRSISVGARSSDGCGRRSIS